MTDPEGVAVRRLPDGPVSEVQFIGGNRSHIRDKEYQPQPRRQQTDAAAISRYTSRCASPPSACALSQSES